METEGLGFTRHGVREALRRQFGMLPPTHLVPRNGQPDHPIGSDEEVLEVLLATRFYRGADPDAFRTAYDLAHARCPEMPDAATASERGWFKEVGGRVVVPRALLDFAKANNVPWLQELQGLRALTHACRITVADETAQRHPAVAAAVVHRDSAPLAVRSPRWLAARLWDRATESGIAVWADRTQLLPWHHLVPHQDWSNDDAARFIVKALEFVASSGLPTWNEADAENMRSLRVNGHVVPAGQDRGYEPETAVTKLQTALADSNYEDWDAISDVLAILQVVVSDLAHSEYESDSSRAAVDAIAALADRHPAVMQGLSLWTDTHPALLAEWSLQPRLVTAAASMAARRMLQPTHDAANDTTRVLVGVAFNAAADMVGHWTRLGLTSAADLGDLIVEVHERSRRLTTGTSAICRTACAIAAVQPDKVQRELVECLSIKAETGTATAGFSALCNVLPCISEPVRESVTGRLREMYAAALAPTALRGWTGQIEPEAARALFETLLQANGGAAFLRSPLDLKGLVSRGGNEQEANALACARSLHDHIRLLALAAAGAGTDASPDLVEALRASIVCGSTANYPKARVAALSSAPWFSPGWSPEPPISSALAAAVRAVGMPALQKKLIDAIAQTDDPGLLADVLRLLPESSTGPLRARIEELDPEVDNPRPGGGSPFRAAQSLAKAGLAHQARRYYEHADEMTSAGGRGAVDRFRTQLQLSLNSRELDSILASTVPLDLGERDHREAHLQLEFYKGLAHLAKGEPAPAITIFSRLQRGQPDSAHVINLLAARAMEALGNSSVTRLDHAGALQAQRWLAEAEQQLTTVPLPPTHVAVYQILRARLQLAMGKLDATLESISKIPQEEISAESASLKALVAFRKGNVEEARSVVSRACREFGDAEVLQQVWLHLDRGDDVAYRSLTVDLQSRKERISQAIIEFRHIAAHEQAAILVGSTDALTDIITSQVRGALASLDTLVPFLKLSRDEYEEDDYNAVLHQLLISRLEHLNWQAGDQSKGGRTTNGGVGERDVVIRKDAVELAVIEALRFEVSGNAGVKAHFFKAFRYSMAKLFFVVVYYRSKHVDDRLDDLLAHAKAPPSDLEFREVEPLVQEGNQPRGYRARYLRNSEHITVVFLLSDLGQDRLSHSH